MAHFGAMGGAHIAAAAKQKRDHEEEEERSTYTAEDLAGGWEYKFMRFDLGGFKNQDKLVQILDIESFAGWELVEKIDNTRIRLRRLSRMRERDYLLPEGYDPYSTKARGFASVSVLVLGVVIAFLALGVLGAIYFASRF